MAAGVQARTVTSFDGLSLHVRDHGDATDARTPVLCLPGLTRNAADFEDVATRLSSDGRRVLCPDLRGRGRSAHAADWAATYTPPTYVRDVLDVMAASGVHRAVVIGTSLGGIVGMMLAAARPTALAGLVLNDVGPRLEAAGLARIAAYVGRQGPVADWPAAVAEVRATNGAAFPNLDDAGWERFARRLYAEGADGRPAPAYDFRIGDALRAAAASGERADLDAIFASVAPTPALVVRGVLSDILSAEGVAAMKAAKPDLETVEVPGVGHAPLLDEPAARAAVDAFVARIG